MFRKIFPVGPPATITLDGVAIEAEEGEPLAAVLLRQAPCHARLHPVSNDARAPYCLMGACQECLMVVDGVPSTTSCRTRVRNGMVIERQQGVRRLPDA